MPKKDNIVFHEIQMNGELAQSVELYWELVDET